MILPSIIFMRCPRENHCNVADIRSIEGVLCSPQEVLLLSLLNPVLTAVPSQPNATTALISVPLSLKNLRIVDAIFIADGGVI